MHARDNLNVDFYVKVNDDVYANIDALRTMLSSHIGNARYSTIRKGLVQIREGLLDLGLYQMQILLFSTFHLVDKVRLHREGNDRNMLNHVYVGRTKGRKDKVESFKKENGPKFLIAMGDRWEVMVERIKSQLQNFV